MSRSLFALAVVLFTAIPAFAGNLSGLVTDGTGAPLSAASISVRAAATGQVWSAETGADGRYRVASLAPGVYFVTVRMQGFRDVVRQVVVHKAEQDVHLPIQLADLELNVALNVTAARAERDTRELPLHVETLDRRAIVETNPLSTGDALTGVANITPVGGGPFGVRPRLRGLDSTRVLVLVDGERLNTARLATDRTGAEVGLVSPDSISRLEIVNGAGTLMYGSDALAGTINIITNEPGFSPSRRFLYGVDGFYSSNENGARGTLMFGVTAPRYAVRVQGGKEQFDNYRAGRFGSEDTHPFFASGAVRRADTIDDNFGFGLRAFPDPFNAPYVRGDREILNSQASGNYVNATALVRVHDRQTVRLRYQRRPLESAGSLVMMLIVPARASDP